MFDSYEEVENEIESALEWLGEECDCFLSGEPCYACRAKKAMEALRGKVIETEKACKLYPETISILKCIGVSVKKREDGRQVVFNDRAAKAERKLKGVHEVLTEALDLVDFEEEKW